MSTATYLKAFFTDKEVASVTPSSPFLTQRVCDPIDFDRARTVVEYGPGTGVMTRYLLERLPGDATLLAVEANEKLVSELREKHDDPRLVIEEGDVRHIRSMMDDHGLEGADYVVSGIPFTWMDPEVREEILATTHDLLRPGGMFLAYQTFWQPNAHLRDPARAQFGNVEREFEVRNIPPMRVYRAVKRNGSV